MNERPNWRIDGIDFAAMATIIDPTIRIISNAAANNSTRNIASPVLPVGESARHKAPILFSAERCRCVTWSITLMTT
jgi:hypothetical protein